MTKARNRLVLTIAFLASTPFLIEACQDAQVDDQNISNSNDTNSTPLSNLEQRLLGDFEYTVHADHGGDITFDEWLVSISEAQVKDGISAHTAAKFPTCAQYGHASLNYAQYNTVYYNQTEKSDAAYTKAENLYLKCFGANIN